MTTENKNGQSSVANYFSQNKSTNNTYYLPFDLINPWNPHPFVPWQNPYPNYPAYPIIYPTINIKPINIITTSNMRNSINKKPECYITVNKSRLKSFTSNKNVYMNNNTEFEIELFNPSSETLGVKFKINGQYISDSKIVLYPGKRIYLDRFLDVKKKFKYTTYTVEDSTEAKEAVALNGNIEVEFYREYYQEQNLYNSASYTTYDCNNPSTLTIGNTTGNTANFSINTTGISFCCQDSVDFKTDFMTKGLKKENLSNEIETGIIGKGKESKQDFTNVDMTFEYYYDTIIKYKILPMSQKPIEPKDLIQFCSACGRKAKQNDNFCGGCGKKIE